MRYSEEAHRLHLDPDQPNAQRQSIHGSHQVNQSREKARKPDGMRRDQVWLALQLEAWTRAKNWSQRPRLEDETPPPLGSMMMALVMPLSAPR